MSSKLTQNDREEIALILKWITLVIAVVIFYLMFYLAFSPTNRQTDPNNRLAKATEDLLQQSREFTLAADRLAGALDRQAGTACQLATPTNQQLKGANQ
jgi:Fe2+ transport system protein B